LFRSLGMPKKPVSIVVVQDGDEPFLIKTYANGEKVRESIVSGPRKKRYPDRPYRHWTFDRTRRTGSVSLHSDGLTRQVPRFSARWAPARINTITSKTPGRTCVVSVQQLSCFMRGNSIQTRTPRHAMLAWQDRDGSFSKQSILRSPARPAERECSAGYSLAILLALCGLGQTSECPLCHERPFDTQHKMMRIAIPRRLYVVLWERLAGWRHVTRRNI